MQAAFIAIAVAATALMPAPATLAHWLYGATALYAAAIVSEKLDHPLDTLTGGFISGHALKHLLAAAAAYVIYRMLRQRTIR
jgi:membrane-associated phospholipid phosphatase